jgi:hypothetical protein
MQRSFFALMLFCLAAAAPADAQNQNACIDRCFSNFSPSQMMGSDEPRRECLEQCKAPSRLYGAIAYGAQSMAYGDAYGKSSAAEAERSALGFCRPNGNDCKIVTSFSNSCAAVAAVDSKNRFTVGQGSSRAQAQSKAMASCASQIGGKCEIQDWSCSGN